MKLKTKLIITLLYISFISCSPSSLRNDYRQLKSNTIMIPDFNHIIIGGKDASMPDFLQRKEKMKLVIYMDSVTCNSCAVKHIDKWIPYIKNGIIDEENLIFYFIFSPMLSKINDVRLVMKSVKFDYPMILDKEGVFIKSNTHIPNKKIFHTFLLNDKNEIIMVGDPTSSVKMKKLFWETVKEQVGYNVR